MTALDTNGISISSLGIFVDRILKYPKPYLGCDIGGAKEPGVIYFPINWGAKEPQNLPNHRVATLW